MAVIAGCSGDYEAKQERAPTSEPLTTSGITTTTIDCPDYRTASSLLPASCYPPNGPGENVRTIPPG